MSTTSPGQDLPEAADRRLASRAFSSGLGVADFAACLHMGMRPVGLVQGFCVMGWNPSLFTSPVTRTTSRYSRYSSVSWGRTLDSYHCPHPYMYRSDDHPWYGFNVDIPQLADVWATGYNAAHQRMLQEADRLGAHGVLAVLDASHSLIGPHVREFHLLGTAVVMEGSKRPARPWSTYLAGAKLAKLLEAGMVPESICGSFAAVSVIPSCVTETLEHGRYDTSGVINSADEVKQLSDAGTSVRHLARERLRQTLGDAALYGADLQVTSHHLIGHLTYEAILKGTRVRQAREAEPLPPPIPTVRLSS